MEWKKPVNQMITQNVTERKDYIVNFVKIRRLLICFACEKIQFVVYVLLD